MEHFWNYFHCLWKSSSGMIYSWKVNYQYHQYHESVKVYKQWHWKIQSFAQSSIYEQKTFPPWIHTKKWRRIKNPINWTIFVVDRYFFKNRNTKPQIWMQILSTVRITFILCMKIWLEFKVEKITFYR